MISIVQLAWDKTTYALNIGINGHLLLLIGGLFLFGIGKLFFSRRYSSQLIEMGVEISGNPKAVFKVKRDYSNLYIANRIYIELITRKIALPFEEDKDVILEVYDSWYQLFGLAREEIKNIPGHYLASKTASTALISLTTQILNEGLRPHLTRYQAAFRKWYKEELTKTESKELTPQQIQAKFPQYQELVADIKKANRVLVDYSELLKQLIEGKGSH